MKIFFLQGIIDVVAKVIVDVIVDVIVHSGPEDGESDEAEEEETEESEPNPLLADLGTTEAHLSKQASLWFKRVSLLNTIMLLLVLPCLPLATSKHAQISY